MKILNAFAITLFCWIVTHTDNSTAQGNLTPPGAPAPGMLTLSQVEPRIPLSALPITISNSGSYYFTTNIIGSAAASGIVVTASDVTIDLKGYELKGVSNSSSGITVQSSAANITVINGTIRNWSASGITASAATACVFKDLRIIGNGYVGIFAGQLTIAKDCLFQGNTATGLLVGNNCFVSDCVSINNQDGFSVNNGSVVTACTAFGNSSVGIFAGTGTTIQSCTVQGNSTGIFTLDACTIVSCTATKNNNDGIYIGNGYTGGGSTVRNCTVTGNVTNGIHLFSAGNQIMDNVCSFNGPSGGTNAAGIRVEGVENRIEGNTMVGNANRGLKISGHNIVIRNTASLNTVNYDTNGAVTIGPDVTSTGTITNTSPWANFEF